MCFANRCQAGVHLNHALGHGVHHGVELFDRLGHLHGDSKEDTHGNEQTCTKRPQHDARVHDVAAVVFLNLGHHGAHGGAHISGNRRRACGHLSGIEHHRSELFNLTRHLIGVERLRSDLRQTVCRGLDVHDGFCSLGRIGNRLLFISHS